MHCKQLQAHQTGGATAQNRDFGGFPNASRSSMIKPDSPSPRPTIPVFPGCLHLLPVVLREDGRVRTKNRNAHLRGLKVETLKSARAYCSTSAKLAEISAVEAQSNTMTVSQENKATFKVVSLWMPLQSVAPKTECHVPGQSLSKLGPERSERACNPQSDLDPGQSPSGSIALLPSEALSSTTWARTEK